MYAYARYCSRNGENCESKGNGAIGCYVSEVKICSRFGLHWNDNDIRMVQPCGIQVLLNHCLRCVPLHIVGSSFFLLLFRHHQCVLLPSALREWHTRRREFEMSWIYTTIILNRINNWRRRTNILKIVTNDSLFETANCLLRAILVCVTTTTSEDAMLLWVYVYMCALNIYRMHVNIKCKKCQTDNYVKNSGDEHGKHYLNENLVNWVFKLC